MPVNTVFEAVQPCPAAIAIHNNGHMARQPGWVNLFLQLRKRRPVLFWM
jgi:hypothetical protein